MGLVSEFLDVLGGRRFVLFLGGFYVLSAFGYPLTPFGSANPAGVVTVFTILVGVPGLAVFYGGYRLPSTEIHPDFYDVVGRWILRCLAVVVGILVLVALVSDLQDVVPNVFILTALGSVAGVGIGTHEAQTKTRERELEVTIEQLRTANERLEQFAYAASHDLQEPLRMVSSYVQLLDRRYGDELDEDAREFMQFAVDGADRMRTMVDSLLQYSRVNERAETLEPTEASVVVDGVVEDLHRRIEETDATVTVGKLPTVMANADLLAQTFRNLLTNALKYHGEAPPEVEIRAERDGEQWCFSVADSGVGIDPEYHEQIFEVFEKLEPIDDDRLGSSGIGLALCERIVERHGGEIWVESTPSEGATFYFTLPDAGNENEAVRLSQTQTLEQAT